MDKALLSDMTAGSVVIACVGNEMRGDDGVGPFIGRLLRPSDRVKVVDCGETPENFLGVISGYAPEKVVIIDAAEFGGQAGDVKIVRKDEIKGGGLSTHDAVLTLFADFIEVQTGARTIFLAIQPEYFEFGDKLSARVEKSARDVARAINDLISSG